MQGAREPEVGGGPVDRTEREDRAPFDGRAVEVSNLLQQGGQLFAILDLVGVDVGELAQDLGGPRPVPAATQQRAQRDARVVVALVEGEERAVVRDGPRRVALFLPDAAQEPMRAPGAAVLGEELERGREVLHRLRAATVPEQGLPEGHAWRETARIACDLGLQRGDVRHDVGHHRRVLPGCRPLGLPAHRGNRRGEAVLQEVLEVPVEVIRIDSQRPLERLLVGCPVAVGVQHLNDGGKAVPLLDHLEDQRRLVVAVPDLAGVARARKAAVQFAHRPQFARRQRPHEAQARLMAPAGVGLALFHARRAPRRTTAAPRCSRPRYGTSARSRARASRPS